MKILVIRFSSIGDIVLTTPVLRCIKTQLPGAELHVLTKDRFATVLGSNLYIDRLILLGKSESIVQKAKELRKAGYTHVIDLHNNLRSRIIRLFQPSSVKISAFNKLNFEKWLLVNLKINKLPDLHIVDRYIAAAAKYLTITNDHKGLDYVIPDIDRYDTAQLPLSFRNAFYAYAIGGQHNTKKLPLHKMIALCQNSPLPMVLLGGREDAVNGTAIEESLNNSEEIKVISLCGKLNLNQSASVLQQAQTVYTHDTGLMHIAAALHKPIVSIWGNTVPEFGMYPYEPDTVLAKQNIIFEVKSLSCRPCSKIGFEKCPKGHFKCMEDQVF